MMLLHSCLHNGHLMASQEYTKGSVFLLLFLCQPRVFLLIQGSNHTLEHVTPLFISLELTTVSFTAAAEAHNSALTLNSVPI